MWEYNYSQPNNDELYHHGVKGMKWGRHKAKTAYQKAARSLGGTRFAKQAINDSKYLNSKGKKTALDEHAYLSAKKKANKTGGQMTYDVATGKYNVSKSISSKKDLAKAIRENAKPSNYKGRGLTVRQANKQAIAANKEARAQYKADKKQRKIDKKKSKIKLTQSINDLNNYMADIGYSKFNADGKYTGTNKQVKRTYDTLSENVESVRHQTYLISSGKKYVMTD